jgi:hypothetical protein
MSKKNAIILILAVVMLSLGALLWLYFTAGQDKPVAVMPTTDDGAYDPFGTKMGDSFNQNVGGVATTTETPNDIVVPTTKLRQITTEPISGFGLIVGKDKKLDIQYMLRMTGHIHEAYSDSLETKRLSNTTIPKVQEAIWSASGQGLIVRYLKDNLNDIVSYSVKLKSATSSTNEFEGSVDGNFLSENLSTITYNPTNTKIYSQQNNLGGASGIISNIDGTNKRVIFESPLVEWLVSWPKEDSITLTTKPSGTIDGYMYLLNSQSGALTKVLGGVRGLTTKMNAASNSVLYSDSTRGTPRLYLLDRKTNESKLLPWNTFPEKCVWSNGNSKIIYCAVPKNIESGVYPDVWYQGLASFADDIWRIDMSTGASNLLSDLKKESNQNIDVVDMQIDKDDSGLFFVNKTDLTFWTLGLK